MVQAVIGHPEQVYGDVNLTMVEHLLRLEPDHGTAKEIRGFAAALLNKPERLIGGQYCAAVAPLLLLRFADGRSLRGLKGRLDGRLPPAILRACGIVYASQGRKQCDELETAAGELLRSKLSLMVRLLRELKAYEKVPDRFKRRLGARKEILADKMYVDMRRLLTARLLCLNQKPTVQLWVKDWKLKMVNCGVSDYDRALLTRLIP